jgi:hypothetical protein
MAPPLPLRQRPPPAAERPRLIPSARPPPRPHPDPTAASPAAGCASRRSSAAVWIPPLRSRSHGPRGTRSPGSTFRSGFRCGQIWFQVPADPRRLESPLMLRFPCARAGPAPAAHPLACAPPSPFQEDFRNFWDECPWEEDLRYARQVCVGGAVGGAGTHQGSQQPTPRGRRSCVAGRPTPARAPPLKRPPPAAPAAPSRSVTRSACRSRWCP